jgi:Family of unknown function (DUF6064)
VALERRRLPPHQFHDDQRGSFRFWRFVRSAVRLARAIAALLIFYGIALHSLAGIVAGHTWRRMPLFGTTPCSVTIFTLGLLPPAAPSAPWWLAVVPLIWSAIGTSAGLSLDVYEDLGVLVAAVAFLYVRLRGSA